VRFADLMSPELMKGTLASARTASQVAS